MRITGIVHNGKGAYDHIRLENGDTIALQYHPFYTALEAYEDIAVEAKEGTVTGRATIVREMTGDHAKPYALHVTTYLAGENRRRSYHISEHQYFHPNKDTIHGLVVQTLYDEP